MFNIEASCVNSMGLGFDIVGVVLIFFFGIAAEVRKDGAGSFLWGNDQDEAKKWKRFKWLSYLGLVFLVVGFSMQILSNHI